MSKKLTYDKTMFVCAALILLVGLVMIYSASAMIANQKIGTDNPYYFLTRQCIWLLVAGALMFALMHVDLDLVRDPRVIAMMLAAVSVALVLVLFQAPINGTHRWFVLPYFQFQPAEVAKPVIVLVLAAFLAAREERIDELSSTLLPLSGVLALVGGLILLQPDFGTAATIFFVAAAMVFAAGVSWKRIAVGAALVLPVAVAVLLSADYRRERLTSFLNPEADPLGKGFQAMQSLIALGTGGVQGLGIGNGRQKLFFLPEPHTDFIFSIIGEELGFIGALALLAIFGVFVVRGLRLAHLSGERDRFVFYAALGLTLMIAVQVLINVSVALCLLPTKGIPLPLVSYGGSSLLASLMGVGLLLNMSQRA